MTHLIRRHVLRGVLLLALLGAVFAGARSLAVAADTTDPSWVPPPDTIVRITGDAANGFGIHLYGGSALFPPTDSEALAECGEYATRVERVRCRTEVRVWYRDLAATRRAIRYQRVYG